MSVPQGPIDNELVNIINKLANFVARNGPDFEKMTQLKQLKNPKFSFLVPGDEYYNYYQFRVSEERRNLMNMQQQQQPQQNFQNQIWSNKVQHPAANITAQIELINAQQMKLREQICTSENNLSAQHKDLLKQQKDQIEEAISNAHTQHITRCAHENQISLSELDEILQPIIDSCTKESIANGKASILQQATNSAKRQIISQYILKKAMAPNAAFNHKLHLIYLINDLLHHCVKKNAEDLKNCLEKIVIPMFCNAVTTSENEEQKEKLSKLLTLWSSRANFFDSCAINKLQSPPSSLQEYHNSLLSQYAAAVQQATASANQASKARFENFQQQHQAFVQHATNQIALLETQKQQLEQQSFKQAQPPSLMPPDIMQSNQQIPSILNNVMGQQQNMFANPTAFPNQPPVDFNQLNSPPQFQNFNLPPPDFSRPPPGFTLPENSAPVVEEVVNTQPTLPFFELPAGLMVPLVSLEDYNYHGIDPNKLQLPVPITPSEKLLNAIENFYAAPSHERPRDNEGWEKLGLYEYFKIKNAVRKQKEEAIARFEREKSKSPTPIPETLIKPAKKTRKRVYRSKSPEKRSKSRSASPEQQVKIVAKPRPKRRSRSPSPANYRNFNRDSRNERSRKRSITPPSFSVSNRASEFIDEGNKGHQLLKKLGWKEGGLGAGNQGIVQPISGGEIRDRLDLYKGVGHMNDPYENFRKNRSNNFITRMKTRSEAEKN